MSSIQNPPGGLKPGDILLYNSQDLTDALIRWKEGDPDTAHVEVYIGAGLSVASRNGVGVNDYGYRHNGLVHVRRPIEAFDYAKAMAWFATVCGAPYGWGDIGATINLAEKDEDGFTPAATLLKTGMDCDHFAALFLAAGGCPQFDGSFDLRKLTPRDFKIVLESVEIWRVTQT